MKFKDIFNRKNLIKVKSPTGDKIIQNFGWSYIDGDYKYVKKNDIPLYEKIQAARDSVDLKAILRRYEEGDKTALDKVKGMYIDAVDLPKNYAELYTAVSRANDIFDAMPVEIKEKYENNPAKYWRAFGSEAFDDTINAFRKQQFDIYNRVDDNPVNTVDKLNVESEVENVQESE